MAAFADEQPADRRARRFVLLAYFAPVFFLLLPALWLSVDVTQNQLPELSTASDAQTCKALLKKRYMVNVLFAHGSDALRESYAAKNPQYSQFLTRGGKDGESINCVAESVTLPREVFSGPRADRDLAYQEALARNSPFDAACQNAALTLIVNIDSSPTKDEPADVVVGQFAHAWSDLDGTFDVAKVKAYTDALQQHLRGTTKAVAQALKSTRYDLTFFLLNEDSTARAQVSWDFQDLHHQYFANLINRLSEVADITVASDVLHHIELPEATEVTVDSDPDDNETASHPAYRVFSEEALDTFSSLYDWDFGSTAPMFSTSRKYVVVVPRSSSDHFVLDQGGDASSKEHLRTSFSVPQWGGFWLLNRGSSDAQALTAGEQRELVVAFTTLIRASFGIPQLNAKQLTTSSTTTTLAFVPPVSTGVTEWEVGCLHHAATVSFIGEVCGALHLRCCCDTLTLSTLSRMSVVCCSHKDRKLLCTHSWKITTRLRSPKTLPIWQRTRSSSRISQLMRASTGSIGNCSAACHSRVCKVSRVCGWRLVLCYAVCVRLSARS